MNWNEYRAILSKHLDKGEISEEEYNLLVEGIDILEK